MIFYRGPRWKETSWKYHNPEKKKKEKKKGCKKSQGNEKNGVPCDWAQQISTGYGLDRGPNMGMSIA
jgi:hypothetical protein